MLQNLEEMSAAIELKINQLSNHQHTVALQSYTGISEYTLYYMQNLLKVYT